VQTLHRSKLFQTRIPGCAGASSFSTSSWDSCQSVTQTARAFIWGGWEPGAEGSLGLKRIWGGRQPGAEGSMWRMGVRGGREPGAEWRLGRMGALGGPTDRRGFQPALAPNFILYLRKWAKEVTDGCPGRRTRGISRLSAGTCCAIPWPELSRPTPRISAPLLQFRAPPDQARSRPTRAVQFAPRPLPSLSSR
jgi:hypothetical protein